RTFAGGKRELIALCDCGALGTPAELGWAGGSCGPCHDHREEHGTPLAAGDGPPALHGEYPVGAVVFSPSGRTVVAALRSQPGPDFSHGKVCFWERSTGKLRQEHAHLFDPFST